MKHTKKKLVVAILAAVVVSFAIIIMVFHSIMVMNIKDRASDSINLYIDESYQGEYDLAYAVNTLYTDEDFNIQNDMLFSYRQEFDNKESEKLFLSYIKELANWCAKNNPAYKEIVRAKINNSVFFLAINIDDFENGYNIIYYVDVTSEIDIVKGTEAILVFIMALCTVGAGLMGVSIGKSIEKDEEKQKRFFENASHELKTPLMSIQGYAEGLMTGVVKDNDKAYRVIMSETEKMAHLVDEIMCISRLDSGAVKLEKTLLPLREEFDEAFMNIGYDAEKKGVELINEVKEESILADKTQFERVISNILSNALRYAKSRIVVSFNKGQIRVFNDGEKLSESETSGVFDRFHTGKGGKTGIGLSLTKQIVDMHGWKIRAENCNDGVLFIISTAYRRNRK